MNNITETPNWLKNRAFLTPNRLALITNKDKLTFQQLHEKVLIFAKQLASLGIKNGEMTAVLMKNSTEMVVTIHALKYLGAVTVLLNTRLTSHELLWQVVDSKPSFILTELEFMSRLEVIKENNPLTAIVEVEKIESLELAECEIVTDFLMDKADTIMYTSGTTGKPKGVIQSYGNHWWSAVGSALNMGLRDDDCWLAAVPLFHISGLSILMRSVIYGIPVVLHESFNVKDVNDSIHKDKITIVSVVSAMLTQMIEQLGNNKYPSQLRCMLLGGGPAPKPLLEACRDRSIPVFQTYGMTETSSQIVTLSPEYSLSKLGSAGKPLFPSQLMIVTDGSASLAYQAGEIVVKGPNVTKGYLNRADETKDALREGWFHTGDIGYVDEEGFLYVLDRRSDLIVSGGENVYPAEIEEVLLTHSDIHEAGVIGIEDDKWGQIPCAFIIGDNLSEKDVIHFCEHKLAKYKIPKKVYFVDELPRNASNKLVRRKLLDLLK